MFKIAPNKDGNPIVCDYDGRRDKEAYRESLAGEGNGGNSWDFLREGSNHAYLKGEISYENGCENNLVISRRNIELDNVRNAFVLANSSAIEIRPIDDTMEAVSIGLSAIGLQNISYHVPRNVIEKERLSEKDMGELSQEIGLNYGIVPREISLIQSLSKINGVYQFRTGDGRRYVFKYRDKNREIAEQRSAIATAVPDFFPTINMKRDLSGYTIGLEDGWYGLESFIDGDVRKRDLDYFASLGKHIALLHQQFGELQQSHKDLTNMVSRSKGHFGEASAASFYIDLAKSNRNQWRLLSELERIIDTGFSEGMRRVPKQLTHGDLNQSNVLWLGEEPIIIDFESIGVGSRIHEFMPPLLIKGNRSRPEYVPDSLAELTGAYNREATQKLSAEEEALLIPLLKFSLMKYYVVRDIRRGIKDENYLYELNRDIASV